MDAPNGATTTASGGNISTALSEGLTASETVKTEKNVKLTPSGTTGNTMMQKFTSLGSLLGMPVKLPQMTSWYLNWLFGCPICGTEPNSTQQLRYVGIQKRIIWNDPKVMISK